MHFQYPSLKQVGTGLVVLSCTLVASGLYFSHKAKAQTKKATNQLQQDAIDQQLYKAVERHYPSCAAQMLQVYEAIGLMPLLKYHLAKSPPEQTITILNQLLQSILLRPNHLDRHHLNDETYLAMVSDHLKEAYKRAGLAFVPEINTDRLKHIFSQPNFASKPKPKGPIKADIVLLYGSTRQDFENRLGCFVDELSNGDLELAKNITGKSPVYLLSGNRPLEAIDKPIQEKLNPNANEQDMMNYLFDEANKTTLAPFALHPIATNSPKEDGKRPTTASTLLSFIDIAQLKSMPGPIQIVAFSSEPFILYQDLVLKRILLQAGIDLNKVEVITMGPNLKKQQETHPELAEQASMAIILDGLARQMYEIETIARLTADLAPSWEEQSKKLR